MLLDLNMPKINGLQLLRKLKQVEELNTSRIIILTTSDNPSDKAAAFSAGADGFLVKPSSYSALVCLMKSTIEQYLCSHSGFSGGANV
jgi:DNA-binding response OmpR family regulator